MKKGTRYVVVETPEGAWLSKTCPKLWAQFMPELTVHGIETPTGIQGMPYRQARERLLEVQQAAKLSDGQVDVTVFLDGPAHTWFVDYSTNRYESSGPGWPYTRLELGRFPDHQAAQDAVTEWEKEQLKSCCGRYCYTHNPHPED